MFHGWHKIQRMTSWMGPDAAAPTLDRISSFTERIERAAGVFSAMEVAASGLTAERGRMNVIAGNLANGGGFKGDGDGPRYNLDTFADASHGRTVFAPGPW